VVSDHGFLPSAREIRPNVRLCRLGALREARFVMNHGAGALYRLDADERALEQLAREIEKMEGVSGMWSAGDYPALGLPAPADHPQVADVMFEAAPGYSFGDADAGDDEHGAPKYLGTHGQRPTYADIAAFFLASGAGIARGREIAQIKSRDVAPTVARVLGVDMGAVEGSVLEEALE
jgi:hypothetical protein